MRSVAEASPASCRRTAGGARRLPRSGAPPDRDSRELCWVQDGRRPTADVRSVTPLEESSWRGSSPSGSAPRTRSPWPANAASRHRSPRDRTCKEVRPRSWWSNAPPAPRTSCRAGSVRPRAWALRFVLFVAAAYLLVRLIGLLRLMVIPVVVAMLLAALFQPVSAALRKRGMNRSLAAGLVLVAALVLVFGGLGLIVQTFVVAARQPHQQVSDGINEVQDWLARGPAAHVADPAQRLCRPDAAGAHREPGRA